MKMNDLKISCPHCGKNYHPAEIFIPQQFFAVPQMNITEEYTCDSCDTTFNVCAKLSFVSYITKDMDFNTDYERNVNSSFTLSEN
jgi:hypothetical protein